MLFLIFKNAFIDLIDSPPGSMIFVLLLAVATALISAVLTKWLVDTDAIARKQKQIKGHEEEKEKVIALAEVDTERYRKAKKKWERKDAMFKQTQQRMALQRMKPTCITFVPMLVIFFLVRMIFENNPVALSPMHANDVPLIGNFISAGNTMWINFTAWYFLCSFGINTIVQRLLKLQSQASGGMGGMFAGQKAKALEFPEV
ncbi:MAG: EMC3/TMCO1 family protein [Candidatus Hermodarchaeota archaeon]